MKKSIVFIVISIILVLSSTVLATKLLVSKDPAALYFELGKIKFYEGNYEEAAENFQNAVKLNSNHYGAYYNLGVSHYKLNNVDIAILEIKNSINLNQNYAQAYYSLALIYYESGDLDGAITNFEKTVILDENNPNAHFDLAVAYVDRFRNKENSGAVYEADLDDLGKAIAHYQEADRLHKGFGNALSNAAIVQNVLNYYKGQI